MAEYSSRLELTGAYYFDVTALNRIIRDVQEFTGIDPTIVIGLDGGHRIEGTQLEHLIEDPYISNRYIETIRITAHGYKKGFAELDFRVDGALGPVQVYLSGDRKEGILAREHLESHIGGGRQWYSVLKPKNRFLEFVGKLALSLPSAFGVLVMVYYLSGKSEHVKEGASGLLFVLVIAMFATFEWLENRIFPPMLLDIGRSAQRAKSAQHWRTFIFVTVIAAAIIGIVVNVFTDKIMK